MSNWKIKKSDDDDGYEVVYTTETTIALNDYDGEEWVNPRSKLDIDGAPAVPPFNCQIGYHQDKWYEGITEAYWFCEICDRKDKTKRRPK